MFQREGIREGMPVRTADGDRLGTIERCGEATFVIEKGPFLHGDRVCRYEDVAGVENGEVRLALTTEGLARRSVVGPLRGGGDPEWAASEFGGLGFDRDDRGRVTSDPPNLLDPGLGAARTRSEERRAAEGEADPGRREPDDER